MNENNAHTARQGEQAVTVNISEDALVEDPAPDVPPDVPPNVPRVLYSIWFKIRAAKVELEERLRGKLPQVIATGAVLGVLSLGAIHDIPYFENLLSVAVEKTFEYMLPGLLEIGRIVSGCVQFELRCFTEDRFLEILRDYESGKIKQRLEEELLKTGIKTEKLQVEIKNMEEVEGTKMTIEKRYGKNYYKRKLIFQLISGSRIHLGA